MIASINVKLTHRSIIFGFLLSFLACCPLFSTYAFQEVDWSEDAELPFGSPRENIYAFSEHDFSEAIKNGREHAYRWPVDVTGLLIPYRPFSQFLNEDYGNPLRRWASRLSKTVVPFKNTNELFDWMGLLPYSKGLNEKLLFLRGPLVKHYEKKPSGVSFIQRKGALGLTFGCVSCHSGQFLGKTVVGLNNKRSRANQFFIMAKKVVPLVNSSFFKMTTKADEEERRMYFLARENLRAVGGVSPEVLGLDTSLAHVALSLARRNPDSLATKSSYFEKKPRKHPLESFPSSSRPMPWWNLKYKTRWLSDGSLVSGNPILTNFLWNEIGRGTDLKDLEDWTKANKGIVQNLTAFIFSLKAPHWTDFFPAETLDLSRAKRGEKIFRKSCQGCHGRYEKNWSDPTFGTGNLKDLFKTKAVFYPKKTKVIDVGTDEKRWQAMKFLAPDIMRLGFSKRTGSLLKPQKGYVPPPLEGLFLRYPYFHNNSIPNLCALMEREDRRPTFFIQGPSLNEETDYDKDCVGYPVGNKIPASWYQDKEAFYSTKRPGLSSKGHSKVFYTREGDPRFSSEERSDLREFLKTL